MRSAVLVLEEAYLRSGTTTTAVSSENSLSVLNASVLEIDGMLVNGKRSSGKLTVSLL